ncbi:MAG: epoxyqueuosine reductase [Methanomassiliicoccales archaeon]
MREERFKKWIEQEILEFVRHDPGNRLEYLDGSRIFDDPLVGFASGDDPVFERFKEAVEEFHLTPREIAGKMGSEPEALGVISYVLPISHATKEENADSSEGPSERWAHTRLFGERFNRALQNHLVNILREKGHFAVAPEQSPLFETMEGRNGQASTWSQRHVAFAAGLGTFGLSDGLITPLGKAHRLGSVVVDFPLTSPERPGDIHRDCLYFQDGGCMECVARCPVNAIDPHGHDKGKCGGFVYAQEPMIQDRYGIDVHACGLCQTGIPCAHRSPVRDREE